MAFRAWEAPTQQGIQNMYTIRSFAGRDKDRLLAFFEELSRPERAVGMAQRWHWERELDPRAVAGEAPYGAVAEADGKIAGSVSFMPAGLFIGGRPVEAYWQYDSMVHPDYRRRGIASKLITHGAEHAVMLAKGTSQAMLATRQRNGYKIVESSGYWIRNLSFTPRVARVMGRFLARLVGGLLNLALRKPPPPSPEVVTLAGDFDDAFDGLWEDAREAYPAITLRNQETLQWRYREKPDSEYSVIVFRKDRGLRGYAVLETFTRRQRLRGKIVDLLTRRDDEEARRELLAAALAMHRANGADSVYCYATDATLIGSLKSLGFGPKRRPDPMTVLGELPESPYITEGDGI